MPDNVVVQRFPFLQVVVAGSLIAGAVEFVQYEAVAHAAPKSKLDTSRPEVGSETSGPTKGPDFGKGSFYIRKESGTLLGNSGAIVAETCDDKDDVAFNSTCTSAANARIQSERMIGWTRNDVPAEVECRFFNDNNTPIKVEAHIYCLKVDADE